MERWGYNRREGVIVPSVTINLQFADWIHIEKGRKKFEQRNERKRGEEENTYQR